MRPEEAARYQPEDFMPDGRLKLSKFRQGWQQRRAPVLSSDELQERQNKVWDDWTALPEPRPDYLEWAANQFKRDLFNELLSSALTGRTDSQRSIGIRTLLEFTKSKPKQQLEVSSAVLQPAAPQELMEAFSQIFRIPIVELEKLISPN